LSFVPIENQLFGIIIVHYSRPNKISQMNFDLSHHDLESLEILYESENEELKARLLSGALWEEVKEQRLRITELSIALHKKLQSIKGANPAEFTPSDIEGR
jgi:hypothetical protein